MISSIPKDKGSKYTKIFSWVRKDNFVTIKAEYYDKKGDLEKTFKVLELDEIDGIWTTLKLFMENHSARHTTLIEIKKVKYNTGITDSKFEKRELKK